VKATRSPAANGGRDRALAKVSLLSQTGPTTSNSASAAPSTGWRSGTMPCQASYIAGRTRSFIAASRMTKFRVRPGLMKSTRDNRTPASPQIDRPGSHISWQPRSPTVSRTMRA
jgi:hypothetical protein